MSNVPATSRIQTSVWNTSDCCHTTIVLYVVGFFFATALSVYFGFIRLNVPLVSLAPPLLSHHAPLTFKVFIHWSSVCNIRWTKQLPQNKCIRLFLPLSVLNNTSSSSSTTSNCFTDTDLSNNKRGCTPSEKKTYLSII